MFLLISCALFSLLLLPRISIHLMFLLIYTEQDVFPELKVISIHLMFLLIVFWQSWHLPGTNFNTSHVSINLDLTTGEGRVVDNFNTSHVSINQVWTQAILRPHTNISIHLMFLLIQRFYQLFRFYYISNSLKIPAFSNFFQV